MEEFLGNQLIKGNDITVFLKDDKFNSLNTYQIANFAVLVLFEVSYNLIIEVLKTVNICVLNSEARFKLYSHIKCQ